MSGAAADTGSGPPPGGRSAGLLELVEELCSKPRSVSAALRPPSSGGIPARPGLYCWWTLERDAVPGVRGQRIAGRDEFLLYVGVSPNSPQSKQNLRSRVGTHARGNIGASTFRFSLAALLWQEQKWRPLWRKDRPLLAPQDNEALTRWQALHLRIGWVVRPKPWLVEDAVIARLAPPINLAANTEHPLHRTMSAARGALRAHAKRTAQPAP